MASWFVRPETITLPISDGITITVRKRLTAGELRARIVRSSTTDPTTGQAQVNWMQINLCKVSAYLLDWTVPDDSGTVVPIRGLALQELETILDLLEPERFAAIHNAIDAHETAMQLQREEEKKNGWREHVSSDLNIARRCGWRYEWVAELEADVYTVLVEELLKEQDAAQLQ